MIGHCAVVKLTIADVVARADWPAYRDRRRAEFEAEATDSGQ